MMVAEISVVSIQCMRANPSTATRTSFGMLIRSPVRVNGPSVSVKSRPKAGAVSRPLVFHWLTFPRRPRSSRRARYVHPERHEGVRAKHGFGHRSGLAVNGHDVTLLCRKDIGANPMPFAICTTSQSVCCPLHADCAASAVAGASGNRDKAGRRTNREISEARMPKAAMVIQPALYP